MQLNPFKKTVDKVNAAADNANNLINETRAQLQNSADACKSSIRATMVFQGIKAACSLICVGLLGFIAYQVADD